MALLTLDVGLLAPELEDGKFFAVLSHPVNGILLHTAATGASHSGEPPGSQWLCCSAPVTRAEPSNPFIL